MRERQSPESEDEQDLAKAHTPETSLKAKRPWWAGIGPGLVTGGADDDPSGIGTYSQCGASYGYGQLWLVTVSLPLMIAIQEMCGRLAAVTGQGIAAIMKQYYPRWLLYGALVLLFGANTLNVYADLNVMAASANMLFGLPTFFWLTLFAIILITSMIFLSYRVYARILKFLCLGLLGYVIVGLLPGVHTDWPKVFRSLVVPSFSTKLDYQIAMVAFWTTISPYLFFWQAGETVEDEVAAGRTESPGPLKTKVTQGEIRSVRADTVIGMCASQLVAFFIIVATAGTLYATHKTDINTAKDAAEALRPLGPAAVWIFAVCMIGTGMLSIPTMAGSAAYAASETFSWRYGLYRRFVRARSFYMTGVRIVVIGYILNFFSTISPIKALIYSAVVNGIAAVPLMVVLLMICNNRKIVGDNKNGPWSNLFGGLATVLMAVASAFFIWAVVSGKAS